MRIITLFIFVLLFNTACNTGGETSKARGDFPLFERSNAIQEITIDKKVSIWLLEEGIGPKPVKGNVVSIEYAGFFENGKKFDDSFWRETPLYFELGTKAVIEGLDMAMKELNFGAKAIISIPPELAYGEEGRPPNIPANSTLLFHIMLLGEF